MFILLRFCIIWWSWGVFYKLNFTLMLHLFIVSPSSHREFYSKSNFLFLLQNLPKICPWWSSTMLLTYESPKPCPFTLWIFPVSSLKNLSKILFLLFCSIPMPLSEISIIYQLPSFLVFTFISVFRVNICWHYPINSPKHSINEIHQFLH